MRSAYHITCLLFRGSREGMAMIVPTILRRAYSKPAINYVTYTDLESKISGIKDSLITKEDYLISTAELVQLLQKHHQSLEERLVSLQYRNAKMQAETQSLKKMMAHVTAGLGIKFEKYNKAWLEVFLRREGLNPHDLKQGHREKNVGPWREVEIDLFSHKPAIIVECTSFQDKNEFSKVRKLKDVRDILNERYGAKFQAYFMTLAIHARIREQVRQYCYQNNITLITQFT